MFDKTKPLWLPAGSIRAILAMAVVAVVLYEIVAGSGLTDQLLLVLTGVLLAYGAMRYRDAQNEPEEFYKWLPESTDEAELEELHRKLDMEEVVEETIERLHGRSLPDKADEEKSAESEPAFPPFSS